jgi:hypothetical protein
MPAEYEDERAREARAALDRVARDSEAIGSSSLGRVLQRGGDHFAARDALEPGPDGKTDPIELWGRRIGRAISVVVCVALAYWLGVQLGWLPAP